ncbi:MAG: DUF6492 family protein [Clostridium sp.]|nr:DUF6492 family protein [Clostridium sp.]
MNPVKKRKHFYFLNSLFVRNFDIPPTREMIDVVIPVISKDLKILPYCLEGIRRCVTHPIGDIIIVAPAQPDIQQFCQLYRLKFVAEDSVLGFGVKDIHYVADGVDRSGWIFQQLLKWSGTISEREHFLVIDADHILIRPHTFLSADGRTVFYRSREYHEPYYQTMRAMLGSAPYGTLSYVAHKMLFSRSELQRLKADIEAHCGCGWIEAILRLLDPHETSCFSEYETYGCFFPKGKRILRPWRNKNLTTDKLCDYDKLVARYKGKYRAITFPDYKSSK